MRYSAYRAALSMLLGMLIQSSFDAASTSTPVRRGLLACLYGPAAVKTVHGVTELPWS
jgi:hypothetical protein